MKKRCEAIIYTGKQCKYNAMLRGLCVQHFQSEQDGKKVKRITNVQDN